MVGPCARANGQWPAVRQPASKRQKKWALGYGWSKQLVGRGALRRAAWRNTDALRRTVTYRSRFQDGYQQARTTDIKVDVQTMLTGAVVGVVSHSIVIMVMRRIAVPMTVMVVSVMGVAGLIICMSVHKKTGEHPG